MTETRSERGHANRLIREKSPYLIKHAYNPVDWFPWGAEALEKAKKEDKPVFLSIGYSTCHWCTVMEHESFENEAIATQLNRDFVPIKVDREERPDLDDIYMKAVMAMTRQGGWPLSVFLTPDLKPFYGGTYFPPSPRHGLPAFPDVLNLVADLWKNKREMVTENSNGLAKYIQEQYATPEGGTLSKGLLDACYAELVSSHDEQYGGFAGPPKFPLPSYLEFLLRYRIRTKRDMALRPVKKTLESLASGGIHDHLAGGFHRYSTDRFWLVPHFEKMLYDNALLAKVFLEGHQVMGGQSLLETARDTLEWMLNEMRDTNGGFYSAQDADTSDGEGYYYTWSPAETESILGREDSSIFNDLFGVTPEGDFEGARSILHRASSVDRVATKYGRSTEQVVEIIEKSKAKLLTERQKRARPAVDDKVLTSWNGLAISAFALGYAVTGEERYLRASTSGAAFILDNMVKGDLLFRRYRDGEVAIEGTLEDYSFLASALLDVYEATFDARWLEEAIRLAGRMTDLFWDSKNGGFFMNASMEVLARIKEGYDGPTPSGNSMAALLLLRLSEFTGREDLREKAELTMKAFGQSMDSSPLSHTFMLCALDFWFGSKEIVLAGPTEDPLFRDLVAEIRSRFIPNKVVALSNGKIQELSALTGGKTSQNGRPTVYICENFACKKPVSSLDALREQLVA